MLPQPPFVSTYQGTSDRPPISQHAGKQSKQATAMQEPRSGSEIVTKEASKPGEGKVKAGREIERKKYLAVFRHFRDLNKKTRNAGEDERCNTRDTEGSLSLSLTPPDLSTRQILRYDA